MWKNFAHLWCMWMYVCLNRSCQTCMMHFVENCACFGRVNEASSVFHRFWDIIDRHCVNEHIFQVLGCLQTCLHVLVFCIVDWICTARELSVPVSNWTVSNVRVSNQLYSEAENPAWEVHDEQCSWEFYDFAGELFDMWYCCQLDGCLSCLLLKNYFFWIWIRYLIFNNGSEQYAFMYVYMMQWIVAYVM